MPIFYGDTKVLEALPYGSVQAVERHKSIFQSSSFWRVAIVLVEIGVGLVASAVTDGAASPLLMHGITTLTGIAGAAANVAVSAAFDELSLFGVSLDIMSAFIPAGAALRTASKISKSAITGEKYAEQLLGSLRYKAIKGEEKAFETFKSDLFKARRFRNKWINKRTEAIKLQKPGTEITGYVSAEELAINLAAGGVTPEQRAAYEVAIKSAVVEAEEQIGNTANRMMAEAARKYRVSIDDIAKELQDWERVFEEVKNISWVKKLTKGSYIRELEKIGGQERVDILSKIYLSKFNNPAGKAAYQKAASRFYGDLVTKGTSQETMDLFQAFYSTITYAPMSEQEMRIMLNSLLDSLGESQLQDFIKIHNSPFFDDWLESLSAYAKKQPKYNLYRRIRYFGSSEFNDKWVQRIQLIDPNDLGRAPVEALYKRAKKLAKKIIIRKNIDKAGRLTKKVVKRASSIEKAFVKAGGALLPPNRYILGVKRVTSAAAGKFVVLVKFNKWSTSTNSGKNKGGKKDILVRMTEAQYAELISRGVEYWFEVGHGYGWFISRGGKRTAPGGAAVSSALSLFLGFVPIPALRLMLSIWSNATENLWEIGKWIAGKNKDFMKDWTSSVERAFVRSGINRTGRLFSRTIVGDLARKFGAGKWVGRELQRFTTITLSTFETVEGSRYSPNKGMFKWRTKFGKEGWVGVWGKKMAVSGVMGATRSGLLRKSGKSGIGNSLIASRRNLGQIGRIYGAVTPNSLVKPLRTRTRIKRKRSRVAYGLKKGLTW